MLAGSVTPVRNPLARLAERLDRDSERAALLRVRDAAYADVTVFATHAVISGPLGRPLSLRENAWSWQWAFLALVAASPLTVVLKARQLGVSWLAALFALWKASRRPGQTVLLISRRQDDADKLLAKVAYLHARLPEWRAHAQVGMRTIRFPGMDSEIESMPAHRDIGRSRTADLVVLDEHAHQPFAREILAAVRAAAEHGTILSVSTGNGQGTLHADLFAGASRDEPLTPTSLRDGTRLPLLTTRQAGPNGWRAVFIPFDARAGRDEAWRLRTRTELEALSDAAFAQEYPRDAREAIQATGRPVFRPEDLSRQPLEQPLTHSEPGLAVYRGPDPGKAYVIGADVAEGLERSDWSSATVLERDSGEQVAQLRGRWTPDVFAARLDRLARHYATAAPKSGRATVIVAVERNNHGHAVLLRLSQLHGGQAPYALWRARDKRLGWLTTSATRPVLIDQLEAALRTGGVTLHDPATVDQCATFHWSDDGRAEAVEGHHDDDVLALGIAWEVRRRSFGRVLGRAREAAA